MEDNEKQQEENLPTVLELLEQWTTPGTVTVYPEKDIVFPNSKLSPVKSLKVNICSTETREVAILHRLHTKTKIIASEGAE